MNTDIRLSIGFFQNPKTRKLEKRLGLEGVIGLQKLWLWAAQSKPDGDLSGLDSEDIELAADWSGEDGAFTRELVALGWIDETETGYCLHDWADHNPWQAEAKSRSDKARQAAASRWGGEQAEKSTRSQRLAEARKKGTHTKEEWQEMLTFFDSTCVKCGAKDVTIVKDHITPIYQGGSDGIDNIQPLCCDCNASKGPENKDWRSHYAGANGKKMPSKWLPNACETPADLQKTPANACKNASPSPFLSSPIQKGNINIPPLVKPENEDSSPASKTSQRGEEDLYAEPGIDFLELREYYNEHFRPEGPMAGFAEFKQLRAARSFPGMSVIYHDLGEREKARCWNKGYAPSLAKYFRERTWLAPITPNGGRDQPQGGTSGKSFDVQGQAEMFRRVAAKFEKEQEDNANATSNGHRTQVNGAVRTGAELRQGNAGVATGILDASARAISA